MVDTQLFWYKIKEWLAKMADKVTDFVYTDSSKESVDVINLLLLGWILLGLVIYVLGNIIATQLRKRKPKEVAGPAPADTEEQQPCSEETLAATTVPPTECELSRTPNIFVNSSIPKPLITPVCSGDDTDLVDWINNVFSWICNQHIVSPLLESWLSALNARTRLASAEHGVLVDFKSVVRSVEPPIVTEAFESIDDDDRVNISCYFEALKLVFDVLVTQVKEKENRIYKFILNLNRLAGQVNIECDPIILSHVVRFSEAPQVELTVEANPENPILPEDYEPLCNLISEIATDAFIYAVVQQNFLSFPECPTYQKAQDFILADEEKVIQKEKKERLLVKVVKASNLETSQSSTKPYCIVEMDEPPQRFETTPVEDAASPFWDESFIFILRGTAAELLFEIYDKNRPDDGNFLGLCIVSVEELAKNPSQRQIIPLQSRPLEKDNVSGTLTVEFLFLDRDIPTPEVTQLGETQAKNDATGKVIETNSRVTAGGTIITTTTIKRTAEGDIGNVSEPVGNSPKLQNGSVLGLSQQIFLKQMIHDAQPGSELHDLDDDGQKTPENEQNDEPSDAIILNSKYETGSSKPCMNGMCGNADSVNLDLHDLPNELHGNNQILHAEKEPVENLHASQNSITNLASKILNPPGMFLHDNELGSSTTTLTDKVQHDDEITETALKELEKSAKSGSTNKSMLIIHSVQRADNSNPENNEDFSTAHPSGDSQAGSAPSSPSRLRNGVDRSRPKEKKSLIRNLRKKLSFRKPRSRSMETQDRLNASPVPGAENNRSVSSDRAKSSHGARDSPSLKSGRKNLGLAGSSRSSFSEASGLSTASSRTYINENSTLVIEINENGIIKRYLIPTSMIHRSKWKKRGIKLHLFNDHVFVAKHLSGSTLCHVCKKYLIRRPGKQGYECRDCNLQCHKSCHVKVPEYCPNSSVTSMEVEYIHDPRITKPKAT